MREESMKSNQKCLQPAPLVNGLKPYSPGRPATTIDLFLDSNEGPPAPSGLATALATAATGRIRSYPSARSLEQLLARQNRVPKESVLVTAGADEGLERAVRAVCCPGRRAILTAPSFEMIGRYARLTGAEVVEIPWWTGDYPVEQVLRSVTDDTSLVAVVSPNNPTGATISPPALIDLAEYLPGCLILLDHAYVEMAEEDLTEGALMMPNVVVTRTFSKAWGLAGLRVGWAAGDPKVIGWMRSVGQPYSVSAVSLLVAEQLLQNQAGPSLEYIEIVCRQRRQLSELLARLGAEPLPSQANFVLARFADAASVHQGLVDLGIAVRRFAGHPLLDRYLRITLPGSPAPFQRLTDALQQVLAEPSAELLKEVAS
jgi:histidinol-phosphate aminotransferase